MSQSVEPGAGQGFRVFSFDRLVSTNDEALNRARAGDPGWLWIIAREQSGGRGRNGRGWQSPPGNLYASLLLIDPAPAARAPELGFVTGAAVASGLREQLNGDPKLTLKWPNDVLYDGAKLSGLLLESSLLPDGRLACVAGIGVNIVSHPEGLAYPATDLAAIGHAALSPSDLLALISEKLKFYFAEWRKPDGFALVRRTWLSLAAGLGGPVKILTASGPVEGLFQTIDENGRLILAAAGKEIAISAGDVFLPSAKVMA